MSGEMSIRESGAPLQYRLSARVQALFLSAALIAISGCVAGEHPQEQAPGPSAPSPNQSLPMPTPPLEPPRKSEVAEIQEATPQLPGTTGKTAWAQGFEGDLILGLDGAVYVAYDGTTIKRVQSVMKNRGLYSGPLNGVLDPPTMESIYSFQEANPYLLRCGVPTPRTRKLLEQGSHTDVVS